MNRNTEIRQGGITIIEVLVIIAIILILVGLFLPTVRRVREPATRMACVNNLKQIGMALHNYAEMHNKKLPGGQDTLPLPTGTIPNSALTPDKRLSWMVSLLPHLEQQPLFERFNLEEAWDSPGNAEAGKNRVPYFMCPAYSLRPGEDQAEVTTYIGVAGLGEDAIGLPPGHPQAGFFGYSRQGSLADVPDGLSNTMLVIETAHEIGAWARGGPSTVRGLPTGEYHYLGEGRAFGGTHFKQKLFGRREQLGANILLGDGSVHFFEIGVKPEILRALATTHGGEPVPED